jgi:hypothetical protein
MENKKHIFVQAVIFILLMAIAVAGCECLYGVG